ncbi:RagB/SusD family nutrient uptake outer membrane protein [Sphingobacterium phlebotomi]|uniref:RagB/SusD family nutrient uptake outer membrane protein n=1 Tax=Sphingobacterium phlebotomi TaxID=2605433 RepID=A0A5D4HAV9_9SPHI|nr:RagB/SusD family nutrient uptake outer membrane protein [Sphingobacterium phlebotomi]TYR35950.1 RagB/SusD family nutrient uptake outer membrane protein [Sphingobacterium phlebotomi]
MKKYIIAMMAIALFGSCADQLEQFSFAAISPDAVDIRDVPAVRNGMYNSVQNDPTVRSFILFDMLGGTIQTNSGTSRDLINATLSPLNATVGASWNGYFSALYQVNNMLAVAERFPEAELASLSKGEAHYFRAYIYFCLATRWGDVPILRNNTMERVHRDPIANVWTFIEEELDAAVALLGSSSSYYYVSRGAAIALKARVMLSQGKMEQAATLAESLITDGAYRLDTFERIFRDASDTETIFAFANRTEESSINISDLFYTYGHPNRGQGAYKPTPETIALFADDDKRKAISLINIAGTECINKYPSGQTGRDPFIVSRIAEMYLISAEAQGRSLGVERLNELRRFRGLGDIFPANDNEYLTAILNERKRELLGENFMYHDLVRTERAKEELQLLDHQHVLPIPGRELQLNPNLVPNPGY